MAWEDITYRCGHTGREQIYGPVKRRPWIAEQRGKKLCPDCYQTALQTQRDTQNAEALAWAAEEVLRLKQTSGLAEVFRHRSYSRSWTLAPEEVPHD